MKTFVTFLRTTINRMLTILRLLVILKKPFAEIKSRSDAADTILLILIGHGGFDGTNSYYCLSDSNLSRY